MCVCQRKSILHIYAWNTHIHSIINSYTLLYPWHTSTCIIHMLICIVWFKIYYNWLLNFKVEYFIFIACTYTLIFPISKYNLFWISGFEASKISKPKGNNTLHSIQCDIFNSIVIKIYKWSSWMYLQFFYMPWQVVKGCFLNLYHKVH